MRNIKNRRFGSHEVKKGRFKGSLHVATESFKKFFNELSYLNLYLSSRLLPQEPEEQHMSQVLLVLQNVLEHESEELIKHYVGNHPTKSNLKFVKQLDNGFVSFKTKFEWLSKKSLVSHDEHNIMEEIRVLRNAHTHARQTHTRPKHKYFGVSLLTKTSLRRIFLDVEKVLQTLRSQSGKKPEWGTVPPGYASEMKWSKEAIEVFDKE